MDLLPPALAFIGDLAGPEMIVVLVIVLLLFGGDKLPGFARGAGKAIREFKKAAAGVEEEFKRALEEDDQKRIVPPVATPLIATPPTAAPVTVSPDAEVSPLPALLPPAPPEATPAGTPAPAPAEPPAPDAIKPEPPRNVVPGDHLP